MLSRLCLFCAALAALLTANGPLYAHGSIPGAEGFIRAIPHPVFEPLQGLALAALSMLTGRTDPSRSSYAWLVFAGTAALGLILGVLFLADRPVPLTLLLGVSLIIGLAVAAFEVPLHKLVYGLSVVTGLVIGANAVSTGDEGRFVTSLGSLIGGFALYIYITAGTIWLKGKEEGQPWLHLVPRVAASWIAAISIILMAAIIRGLY